MLKIEMEQVTNSFSTAILDAEMEQFTDKLSKAVKQAMPLPWTCHKSVIVDANGNEVSKVYGETLEEAIATARLIVILMNRHA